MIRQNLHMHSIFDDGKDTCHDMLEACRTEGMTVAGVSLHSPLPFENDWAARETGPFLKEMAFQKKVFEGRLSVKTGIELDMLSVGFVDLTPFDYVIGAVHHLPGAECPSSVDHCPERTESVIRDSFGGDAEAAAEVYFSEMLKVADNPRVDICAHFDLLTKFNDQYHFFNPESERYQRAARRALHALIDTNKIFEVNTGAISRGWRKTPYPSRQWLLEIAKRGGRVTVSSDAHSKETVSCSFDEAAALIKSCGFCEIWGLSESKYRFVPLPLE